MDDVTRVRNALERAQFRRRVATVVGIVVVLVLTALGMTYVGFTVAEVVRQFDQWWAFVGAFLRPDFVDFTLATKNAGENGIHGFSALWYSLLHPGSIVTGVMSQASSGSVLTAAAATTVIVGFTGTVLGFPLALFFGILGSERVTPYPWNFVFRGTMSTIRAIPALVWILIFIPLLGVSAKAAILAIAVDTIGNMGRLFTDELEEIQDGPIEAISSTGASRAQTVVFGMLSQVSTSFIAWTLYIAEINTRAAISLGVVGAGGLGQYIQLKINFGTQSAYAQAAAGLIMVVFIVVAVELASSRIRARLRPGETEGKGVLDVIRSLGDLNKWLGRGTREDA